MALREFSDRAGRKWRAWDVTAEAIHPATRTEDYMRDYLDGWLAFESIDGLAKCRLTPIPAGWTTATVEQLERWLHEAETVRGDRGSGAFGRASAEVAANPLLARNSPAAPARGPVRTFRFPGGRYWTVTEYHTTVPAEGDEGDGGKSRPVLRFMSGARSLDLAPWPADWMHLSDGELAELLTQSFPRHSDPSESSAQRRRSSDVEKR
jgi:hypothetical protein